MNILEEILASKPSEVEAAQAVVSAREMRDRARASKEPLRGFRAALAAAPAPVVIAELKRRSPSKGEIRAGLDPVACAREFAAGGAAALSVLTDEPYFGGSLGYLREVRGAVDLPILRKDFVVDRYQIDESRVAGADAILLIASALSADELGTYRAHAVELGLDCLVEVHNEAQLEVALGIGADLIGVNNRDLATFEVDLGTTERLAKRIPDDRGVVLVAESGISTHADVDRLTKAGARALLVGESLMRQPNVGRALSQLRLGDAGSEAKPTEGRSS